MCIMVLPQTRAQSGTIATELGTVYTPVEARAYGERIILQMGAVTVPPQETVACPFLPCLSHQTIMPLTFWLHQSAAYSQS